jgi:formylglycine-generating enzyme required for sulfatase activity
MRLVQTRTKHTAQFFREQIAEVSLDMMLIPGGKFMMGSPEDEIDRSPNEGPQHPVTVPAFYLGKYPITQAQWRAVVNAVDSDLDPEPAHFKGYPRRYSASPKDNHPVEQVTWFDATEFCIKLSQLTGRTYRLPSEAEWEYACRAGTETPFYFGPSITTELANYRGTDREKYKWSGSYGDGPRGIFREETTPVGMFPPNVFGLYDMHGNAWEWCQDHYHDSYTGAPENGSAWIDPNAKKDVNRMLRGGGWNDNPQNCRSAFRFCLNNPDLHFHFIGFRVVSEAARTV